MNSNEFLPAPWEEIEDHLPVEQQNALEAVVGSRIAYDDLTYDDL